MRFYDCSRSLADAYNVDAGRQSAAFNLCNPQGVFQCSLQNPNLVNA